MASAIQDVPDQEFNGIRYTGFPEPLSLHRNTTLRHPDANLSPDACIESFDLPLSRSSSRLRFSSSRRVSSKGFIDPKQVYENVLYIDSTTTVGAKPGSSSSSKDISSPSLDSNGRFKAPSRSSSGETDASDQQHQKRKGGLRGLFHKG